MVGIADKKKIEKLFKSKVSSYKIAQVGNMNRMTVWNMREGDSSVDRMEFKNAVTLTKVYDYLVEKGEIENE